MFKKSQFLRSEANCYARLKPLKHCFKNVWTSSCGADMMVPLPNGVSCTEDMDVSGSDVEELASVDAANAVECDPSEVYEDMHAEGISLVAGLRANSSAPFSIGPSVVHTFNQMASSLTSLLRAETANCLAPSGIESHVIGDVMSNLAASRLFVIPL